MQLRYRAKILATVGPSSNSEKTLAQLLDAGVDGFRLNTSHGSIADHKKTFQLIRNLNDLIPILIDLPGIKIRTGILENPIMVNEGDHLVLVPSNSMIASQGDQSNVTFIPVDFQTLSADVKPGDSIFINDGIIHLQATEISGSLVHVLVKAGGSIESRKGINLPDSTLQARVPTNDDVERIKFACDVEADYLAVSFVSNADEIKKVRSIIETETTSRIIPIISKIEKKQALENFPDILNISNGIMVARGDLGVEIPPELVPVEQRRIIKQTNRASKLCIVATQMLDSMIRNPVATRAEISDIYTSVDQGADTVMLSGETASGKYPTEAVKVMHKVVSLAYSEMSKRRKPYDYDSNQGGYVRIQELLSHAVKTMSKKARSEKEPIKAILIPTRYGSTAKVIAKYRPRTPIIASSPNIHVIRELNLIWGLHTIYINPAKHQANLLYQGGLGSNLFKLTLKKCLDDKFLAPDDLFMAVSSSAISPNSPTNLVGLFTAKDIPLS